MKVRNKIAFAVFSASMLAAVQVHAQSATGGAAPRATSEDVGLTDIIVTARRRSEPLQATPLAVSAVNPTRLSETHASTVADISTMAPSLNLSRNATNPSTFFPFLRGFGSKSSDPASEPTVPLIIDGIYQAQIIGNYLNLFDVEVVEVLRGPQGTLLGKNTPAGSINIRTRRPAEEFGGMVQADYGSFNDYQIRSYINIPIVKDKLLSTVSYFREGSDGYFRNIATGERAGGIRTQSIRLGLLFKPTDYLNWYVTAGYDIDKGQDASVRNVSDTTPLRIPTARYVASQPPVTLTCTNAYSRALCGTSLPNTAPYTTQGQTQPRRNTRVVNITSDLSVDAGAVSLASVTGYRKLEERNWVDIDGTQLDILTAHFIGNYQQFSQEFRISSNDGGGLDLNGRLKWLLGAYYFHFNYDRFNDQKSLGGFASTFQEGVTDSYALFGHVEYSLTEKLVISGGLRQTWDQKTHNSLSTRALLGIDPEVVQSASWNNLSVDGTIEYHFTKDQMIYARYAEGYRGGAFTGVPSTLAAVAVVDPETVKSYEVGSKSDFFDHRLRLNLSAFLTKYKNLQRTITQPINAAPFFVQKPVNIATATTKGIEAEVLIRPVAALTLRGTVGYLDARYTSFFAELTGVGANGPTDNTGLKFPYVSKWTASGGFTYEMGLGAFGKAALSADYSFRSTFNVTDLNYAFAWQKSYGLLSSNLTWTDAKDRFSLSVYGRNLTNKQYIDGGDAVGGLTTYLSEAPPRSWGVSAGFKF